MADLELEIQRMVLRMPGLDREEGQRLARLVAQRLSRFRSAGRSREFGRMNVRVEAEPGMTTEQVADRIAQQVLGVMQ